MKPETDIKKYLEKAKRLFSRDFSPLIPLLAKFTIETKKTDIVTITKSKIIFPEDLEHYEKIAKFVSKFKYMAFSEEVLIELMEYLLLHEIKHILLIHFKRKPKNAKQTLWNIACDIAIEYTNFNENLPNAYLKWQEFVEGMGLKIPKIKTAEKIYELLKEKSDCIELKYCFDTMDLNEKDFDENEIHDFLTQYFEYQKMIGNVTKNTVDEYEFVLKKFNIINYITNLVATNLNRNSQKLKIPHRRNLSCFPEVYFEQIVKGTSPHLLVAVDTSGSIREDEFNIFMSGVFNACHDVDIDLVLWDTKIQEFIPSVTLEKLQKVKFKGRGGTVLDCVIDFVADKEYSNLVILTDGYFIFEDDAYRKYYKLKHRPITTLIIANENGTLPDDMPELPNDWDIQCVDILKFLL